MCIIVHLLPLFMRVTCLVTLLGIKWEPMFGSRLSTGAARGRTRDTGGGCYQQRWSVRSKTEEQLMKPMDKLKTLL